MKVAHISSSARLDGGAELCLMNLIKYELNHDVTPVVFLPAHGEMELALTELQVEHVILPYFSWRHRRDENELRSSLIYVIKRVINYLTERRIRKILKNKKVDLVHLNTTAVHSGQKAANQLNIPCIWHIREFNNNQSCYEFYNDACAKIALSAATKCIAVSKSVSTDYIKFAPKANILTIYDSMEDFNQKRERPLLNSSIVQIALIANKTSAKGQIDALEAISFLRESGVNDINLVLIGKEVDLNYSKQLKTFVKDNQLEDRVRFMDFCKEPNEVLAKTDIALNCSRSESFGRTTVEAMMMNCLVIGNDNTCTHELLSGGRGLLYKNSEDLAVKIKWVLQNRHDAKLIAQQGNQFALDSFKTGDAKIIELFKATCIQ